MDSAADHNTNKRTPNAPKRKRRWFQFSLRSLLIFTMVCAVAGGWLGTRMEQKRKEREAVEAIVQLKGRAFYDYQREPPGPIDALGWRENGVEPVGPDWLRKLLGENFFSEVDAVFFDDAPVTDAGLVNLKALTHLHDLTLWSPNVTDAGLVNLRGLTQLQRLDLSGTQVTDAGLVNLKQLTKLQALILGSNANVTDTGLESLTELAQLQTLHLGETNVTDAGLVNLKRLTALQDLDFSRTKVTDAGLENLKGLNQLRRLNLSVTTVTGAGLANLKRQTALQDLDLSRTKVTDAGLVNVKAMTQLQTLRLWRDSNVTDAGLETLKGLTQLRELDLIETKVTAAGVHAIQKSLPNCTVNTDSGQVNIQDSGPVWPPGNSNRDGLIPEGIVVPSKSQFLIPNQTLLKYEPLPSDRK
jgi:hypothetical protein